MIKTLERAEGSAKRGLEYLDKNFPGWEHRTPSVLDVTNGRNCPLFYASGTSFGQALTTLGSTKEEQTGFAIWLGFYVDDCYFEPLVLGEYAYLTMLFRAGREERLRVQQTSIPEFAKEEVGELVGV